jgi:predicted outer membrane repeat protein
LANGGFEGSYLGNNGPLPDNWIGYPHQNSQLVQYFGDNIYNSEETFIPLEGDASLKMWGLFEGENTENNIFQEWQDGELEPGTNLFIEAALMSHFNDSIAVGGNTAFLFAKYFGPNYEFLGMETTEHFDGHHSTNDWHWKGFNAVVPENAFIVQVGAMLVQPTNEDHGSVYIDNFYMERTDGDDTEGELLWVGEFEGHHYYASTSRFLGSEVERLIDDLQSDNENNGLMIYPVSISSEEENQFISNALMNQWTEEETDTTLLIDDYWIGLSDQREENLWEWYNGEELVYTNWSEGEPNGSEDDFAVLWPESNQWASAGDDFMPLIIELEFTDSLNLRDIFVDIVNGSDEEGNGSFEFPFSSITRAVADANNGDQIFVAPGDYEEDVVMIELEDVLIYSMAGPADTRLLGDVDENNLLPAIAAVGSENVTIAGFTFTESSGGAVDAFNTEDLYLFDNNFFNNYTPNSGGGLWSFGSSVQIANCMFENNYAGMDGGGIYFTQTTDSSLVRLDIFSSEFTDNEAIGRGGAIHVANMINSYNMEVSITEVSFVGNVSTSSGGVLVHGPALLAMYRADFHNNFASEHSGALGLENNTYGYSDFGSFVGNHAANGHSGGVSMSSGSNLGLHYNTFADNHSASGAHVTALGLASSQIHGTILWDYGSSDGSGVMVTELDGIGGNISIHESNVWNGESSFSSVGLGFVEYDSESNIEVNPFFCNLEDGDFSLDEMTPAITSDGMVMGAFGVGCSGNVMAPASIVSIDDIPEDQGGRVYVTFEKSIYDTDQPQRTEMYAIERLDGDTWVGLNSVLAYGSDLYVVEATTLGDSTSTDHMISEFRVIASMDEGIFISEPHSGFSIDDIAPNRLVNLVADHSNGIVYLNWDATDANDFSHYNIYYGRNQDFIPNSENLLGTHSSPNFEHDVAELGDHYYILSAVDIHENESEYSDVVSINLLSLLDVHGIPEAYTLHQNFPNPFNPTTQIKYDLPEDALVNINIFDVMGRMIRSLSYGHKSAGYHSLQWDATNDVGESVSAGMYIYTIQAGKYRSTKKMVLLK